MGLVNCFNISFTYVNNWKLNSDYLGGYKIGYELLPINGIITFVGLILISRKQN